MNNKINNISNEIVSILKSRYSKYIKMECVDIIRLIDVCKLNITESNGKNINLSEIILESPDLSSVQVEKQIKNIRTNKSFLKYSDVALRLVHACLKLNVEIFDITEDNVMLKNNYRLIASIDNRKKALIIDHINQLKKYAKNSKLVMTNYITNSKFNGEINILEKIKKSINDMILHKTFNNSDNILTLVLPFFYIYQEYIEVYS